MALFYALLQWNSLYFICWYHTNSILKHLQTFNPVWEKFIHEMGKGDKDEVLTMEDVVEAPVKLNSRCLHTWDFLEVAAFFKKNFFKFLKCFLYCFACSFSKLLYFYSILFFLFCFVLLGFPDGSVVKNPPANAGDMGPIHDPGRPHIPRSN